MKFRSRRVPIRRDVEMILGEKRLTARLVNASVTGARVAGLPEIEEDVEMATLIVGVERLTGQLAWYGDGEAGIAFSRALSQKQFATLTGVGAQGPQQRHARFVFS